MQISSSNFSDPDVGHISPADKGRPALHYKRDGTKVWVWNFFIQDWIEVTLSGGGGGGSGSPQTPWASNINGGGFDLSGVDSLRADGSLGVIDQSQVPDEAREWYWKAEDSGISLYSLASGVDFKWLSISDPNEGVVLHGAYSFHAAGFGGNEFQGGTFNGTSYSVGINQVVGARGAAVADATDAATAITQLNALLARLRTHGLIAT